MASKSPLPLYLAAGSLLLVGCSSGPSSPDPTPPLTCGPLNTVSLAVGESAEFHGVLSRVFCLTGGPGETEYLVSMASLGPGTEALTVQTMGTGTAGGPPSPTGPQPVSGEWGATQAPELPLLDGEFHRTLRLREARELSVASRPPQVGGGAGGASTGISGGSPAGSLAGSPLLPWAVPPTLGAIVSLNAQTSSACQNSLPIAGRVEAVSSRAIVVADTLNPANGFTPSDYQRFASEFDTIYAPLTEGAFGGVTDLDLNGRVVLFFTREVNRLTAPGAASFTAGFFFARDLFPKSASSDGLQACAGSNQGEILYLLVPDPTGSIQGNVRSRAFVDQLTPTTIVHELQHLINAAQRLHVVRIRTDPWDEESWLNEGLSHLAEELLYYRMSGRQPGQNLTLQQLQSTGTRIAGHQIPNLLRFFDYRAATEEFSPFDPQVGLEGRGAAWSLLRYILDRRGGEASTFLRPLVASPERGLVNLSRNLGGQGVVRQWFGDWKVAHYADDRVAGLPERHRHPSWHTPSLWSGLTNPNQRPPLIGTRALTAGLPTLLSLAPGEGSYLRFSLPAGSTGRVEVTRSSGTVPETVRVTLLRTR